MDKQALLDELDTYLILRTAPKLLTAIGPSVNHYQVRGVLARSNSRAADTFIRFYVYNEGVGGEAAYYDGDPIRSFWRMKVEDHIEQWNGRLISANKPRAICGLIKTTVDGEKWFLVEETAPDTWTETETTIKEFRM